MTEITFLNYKIAGYGQKAGHECNVTKAVLDKDRKDHTADDQGDVADYHHQDM